MHEVAGFLRGFPPFEAARDADLDAVVAATEIEFFHQGAWILRAGENNDGFAHVVRTGHVELIDAGRVVDVIGPGDLVGLPSLVSDLPRASTSGPPRTSSPTGSPRTRSSRSCPAAAACAFSPAP